MSSAKPGDRVTISYIGTLDDGRIFADTSEAGPLNITLGTGEVFPALEQAIIGMRPGEVKNILLVAEEAFGPRRDANLLRVDRASLPAERELAVGQPLAVEFADGQSLAMRVIEVGTTDLLLDGNHALAGCDLTFALRLDAIEASAQR